MATPGPATSGPVPSDEVRWLDEREARAWKALQLMNLRVDGELGRRLGAESNLSYPDYVVLVALTDEPEGRLRQFELGCTLGWEKSRLSHHISRMSQRGLVTKEKCPSDARGTFVVVTDLGRREIEAAAPDHVNAVRELFLDHLDGDQLDALADIAETVLEANAVPAPPCDSDGDDVPTRHDETAGTSSPSRYATPWESSAPTR